MLMEHHFPLPDLDDDCTTNNEEPTFSRIPSHEESSFPRISPEQLANWLQHPCSTSFNQVIVLDARFSYEFRDGQIRGAINVLTFKKLKHIYRSHIGRKVVLVFHCELSQDRGPTLIQVFRNYDRDQNIPSYPKVNYPDIYILDGGFSNFYDLYKDSNLIIGSYTSMWDPPYCHNGELQKAQSQFDEEFRFPRRGKISRCLSASMVNSFCPPKPRQRRSLPPNFNFTLSPIPDT